jgi:hypothetical protein
MSTKSFLVLSTLALACASACAQVAFVPSTAEYSRSTSVAQLGIKNIHAQGIIGKGVTVGVLDTGLNLANPEFKGNTRLMTGYNAVTGTTDVTDSLGHGTHVTGIIGATGDGLGMYGVAPGVTILPVKVFNGSTARSTDIDRGLLYASSKGARVINLSLGADGPTGSSGLSKVAATNNTVIVAAAGNSGLANPGWPARYAKDAWAKGTIIAVGAVDANKVIASWSNRAGDTANFYLVAPGVNIYSTYGTGYAYMSGTSMAAPAVTGAAALVTGYWPYLKADQVAAILLNTTDDLGAMGVDAIYGRGMLNVNRALSAQGTLTYKAATGASVTVALNAKGVVNSQPKVTTPSAFGNVVTDVFDEYGRNFTSNEGAALSSRSQMTLDAALGRTDRMLDSAEAALPDGSRFMSLQAKPNSVLSGGMNYGSKIPGSQDQQALATMVSLHLASGHSVIAGDGGLSMMGLGLMDSNIAERVSGAESVLANPLMGFAPNHRFAAMTTPLAGGWSARVGLVRSKADDQAHANVNVLELMHQGRDHALNISMGKMAEQGLLGGYSSSAMGLAQDTRSTGVTFSGAMNITGQWTAAASYSSTRTSAPAASGMLLSATSVRADAWGLGLVKANTWRTGDRLSFTLNAPLAAKSGSMTYSVVDSVNPEDGTPVYGTRTVNLKPTAREWLAETRYSTRLTSASTLTAVAAYRQNPDHDASAPSQVAVGVRYNLSF